MVTIEVNGRQIEALKSHTLLEALRRDGIDIPTLCHIEGLAPSGACRMCVVEVEGANGLVPSCAYPVQEGMKVKTHSPRVMEARKTIIELLLANHPDDCLYCARNDNCELQSLAALFGVRERVYKGDRNVHQIDSSSPSIVRDPNKCVLCGRCVRVCEEIQGVSAIDFINRGSKATVGTAFDQGLNVSSCIKCGQCILACPTGALHEQSYVGDIIDALKDPEKMVVVQHAPAISVTLAEEFGLKAGTDVCSLMTGVLRMLGFERVFDTSFSADLTIMEEGSELVHRLKNKGVLPMMTSCSPGWIKYVEQFYPEFIPNLSTCKSPQQMLGAVTKSFFAEREKIDPKKIYSVAIMPCTAKKFEAQRPEMGNSGISDIDAVLTTRELAELIRYFGIDMQKAQPSAADTPFGMRSSAGKLFGVSGGVMEAAIRSAYFLVTGNELQEIEVKQVRGLDSVKETKVDIDGIELGVAVVSGLNNAKKLLEQIKAGRDDLHFIEVMTCPGGCIAGGGQPLNADKKAIQARMKAIYKIDSNDAIRTSHGNEAVKRLYAEYLGEPLGEKSHQLLHTYYAKRDVIK
ncbi:MAG: [FeFe] hydrogenase, group A [Anaerohalosphaeraceae bacterium]|nr:[FeFe] hydrogenase, group A [Anaerohalosphaeraceae bacterium]